MKTELNVLMLQQHFRTLKVTCGEDTYLHYLSKNLMKNGVTPFIIAEDIEVDEKTKEDLNFIKVGKPYSLNSFIKKIVLSKQRDFKLIHSHEVQRSILFSLFKSRKQPLIIHYRNPLTSLPRQSGRFRIVLNKCDRIIVNSRYVSRKLSHYCDIPEKKIEVIYNGVDTERFRAVYSIEIARKYGIPDDAQIVLYVGRISKIKGLSAFIDVIPKILRNSPLTYFVFAGSHKKDSNFIKELMNKIKSLEIQHRCIFTGFIPHSDLPYILSRANLLVLPSIIEAFGFVVIESLACETPVIAARVGGLQEIVDPKAGILFAPNNNKELSDAILELLHNEKKAKQMGRNGRKVVEQKFSWNVISLQMKRFYIQQLSKL